MQESWWDWFSLQASSSESLAAVRPDGRIRLRVSRNGKRGDAGSGKDVPPVWAVTAERETAACGHPALRLPRNLEPFGDRGEQLLFVYRTIPE